MNNKFPGHTLHPHGTFPKRDSCPLSCLLTPLSLCGECWEQVTPLLIPELPVPVYYILPLYLDLNSQ